MTPEEEVDETLFELRAIEAFLALTEAIIAGLFEPEDVLTAMGLEVGERG